MTTVIWIAVAVLLVGVYLSWTAGRLDRLHARIDAARAALDAQLLRRASIAQEVATSGVFDPAASMVLYQAAHEARLARDEQREVAESALSQALRAVFAEAGQVRAVHEAPGGEVTAAELGAAVRRVPMARRFHNDAVRAARALHRHRKVRWFRLAGHAPFPLAFEMDDEPPSALADTATSPGRDDRDGRPRPNGANGVNGPNGPNGAAGGAGRAGGEAGNAGNGENAGTGGAGRNRPPGPDGQGGRNAGGGRAAEERRDDAPGTAETAG